MKEATDYPPTELETATEGMSGCGMASQSEETKSLKKLRCATKGLKRMKGAKDGDQDVDDQLRTLRMLEEESEAGIIPKNFYEQVQPFAIIFGVMMIFYAFVFSFKNFFLKDKLQTLARTLRWNAITRFFLIFYFPLMILALMTIRDDNEGLENAQVGEVMAYFTFFGLLYFKVYVLYVIIQYRKELMNTSEFLERHNTLTYELRENTEAIFYYPIYLLHKFLFAALLVSIQTSAIGRITVIVVLQISMLLYTIMSKPFKERAQ